MQAMDACDRVAPRGRCREFFGTARRRHLRSLNYRWVADATRASLRERVVVAAAERQSPALAYTTTCLRSPKNERRRPDNMRIDIDPPNEHRADHEAYGFREVGRQYGPAARKVSCRSVKLRRALSPARIEKIRRQWPRTK